MEIHVRGELPDPILNRQIWHWVKSQVVQSILFQKPRRRRNNVSRERRTANVPRWASAASGSAEWIINNCRVAAAEELRKITFSLKSRRHKEGCRLSNVIILFFIGKQEERLVATVVELGNPDGTARRGAEIVLLVYRLGRREEAARVQLLVAQKIIRDAVVVVGPRFRRECHDSTARLAVFRLEPVGVHGELGDGLERRRVIGDLGCIRRSIGRHRNAVERRFPRARLAAAESEIAESRKWREEQTATREQIRLETIRSELARAQEEQNWPRVAEPLLATDSDGVSKRS